MTVQELFTSVDFGQYTVTAFTSFASRGSDSGFAIHGHGRDFHKVTLCGRFILILNAIECRDMIKTIKTSVITSHSLSQCWGIPHLRAPLWISPHSISPLFVEPLYFAASLVESRTACSTKSPGSSVGRARDCKGSLVSRGRLFDPGPGDSFLSAA